jgi:hypothetical protein
LNDIWWCFFLFTMMKKNYVFALIWTVHRSGESILYWYIQFEAKLEQRIVLTWVSVFGPSNFGPFSVILWKIKVLENQLILIGISCWKAIEL